MMDMSMLQFLNALWFTRGTLPLSLASLSAEVQQNKLPWTPVISKYGIQRVRLRMTYVARRVGLLTVDLCKQAFQLGLKCLFLCSLVKFAKKMSTSLECIKRER
jgi:hypothetical protein